jgi:hypothetical protein
MPLKFRHPKLSIVIFLLLVLIATFMFLLQKGNEISFSEERNLPLTGLPINEISDVDKTYYFS